MEGLQNKKPKNPQAFPRPRASAGGLYHEHQDGMTLRDYFAAKAVNALYVGQARLISDVVREAYLIADEMLKQREL